MKKAFLTGITGQDGYYLADYLLNKDYEVHGTVRRSSLINTHRIDPLISEYAKKGQLKLHYSDLIDSSSLSNLVNEIMPDEVYNLAQSHVAVSFKNPVFTTQVGNLGTVSLLEAIRTSNKNIKLSGIIIRDVRRIIKKTLNEGSIFDPKVPMLLQKFFHNMTKLYRDSYECFV